MCWRKVVEAELAITPLARLGADSKQCAHARVHAVHVPVFCVLGSGSNLVLFKKTFF